MCTFVEHDLSHLRQQIDITWIHQFQKDIVIRLQSISFYSSLRNLTFLLGDVIFLVQTQHNTTRDLLPLVPNATYVNKIKKNNDSV